MVSHVMGTALLPAAGVGFVGAFRQQVKPGAIATARPLFDALAFRGRKTYSAMVRVRNEEEFLLASVESIVDLVDEVVLIDNCSTDATPKLIDELVRAYPTKVRSYEYPHDVARYGAENEELAATFGGRRSRRLLANYYNWSLRRCHEPFILKWDGDTVALPALGPALERFRTSPALSLWHLGVNLHDDREHLIGGHPQEDLEPRLFYRRFAHYTNDLGYCEQLKSPYVGVYDTYVEKCREPLYLHLKHCKVDRYSNMSANLVPQVTRVAQQPGAPITDDVRAALEAWGLTR
jgi:glycosyltransferase involved in cell wall biosynthesis